MLTVRKELDEVNDKIVNASIPNKMQNAALKEMLRDATAKAFYEVHRQIQSGYWSFLYQPEGAQRF